MVDWDIIAPMMVAVVLILTVGGVAVLRPISKRLSELAELYMRDRQAGLGGELQQLRDLLETTNARLELLEERQDYMERLFGSGDARRALGAPPAEGGADRAEPARGSSSTP